MILLMIAWHPFHKALFALTLIMMATPPYCTSSSPAYTSLLPLCSVLDPTHFHLVSLISNTLISHPAISLATCTVRVASAMVLTFQQPMVACFQGLLWAFQPLGFPPALAPAASLPVWVVSSMHPVSVTCWRTRGSLFVWSLPFGLFSTGDPTRGERLQPIYL